MIAQGQVQTPKASPKSKVQQTVGLTEMSITYSRPAVKDRVIFGGLVPFGEIWRLGANENTIFRNSDVLIFNSDTLKAGAYALYARPFEGAWEIIFYNDTTNWGLPEKWDDSKISFRGKAVVEKSPFVQENLLIGIENLGSNNGEIKFSWEHYSASLPFKLNTKEKVLASITKTMSSKTISADDYYKSASYYYAEQLDMKQALNWAQKAVDSKGPSAYWMTRLLAQLKAANGDYKGAMETAKNSMMEAEKEGDKNYVKMNQQSMEEWSKKK
jgi:hypothetical protein